EATRLLGDDIVTRVSTGDLVPAASDCFAEAEFVNRAASDGVLDQAAIAAVAGTGAAWIVGRSEIERRREEYFAIATRERMLSERQAERKASKAPPRQLELSSDPDKLRAASIYDGFAGAADGIENFLRIDIDGEPRRWSASQLSQVAACGFAYFAGRILMLREDDEPDYEQNALETGAMAHEVLAELFSAPGADAHGFRRAAAGALERCRRRYRNEARDLAFFDLGWASVEAMVREVIEYELSRRAGGPVPDEMEHESPIEFTLRAAEPIGEIRLRGRIDRLEIYRRQKRIERLKVIDYKMSRNLDAYESLLTLELFASRDLQMGVYALGAVERFRPELTSGAIVEASYIALRHREKEAEPFRIPPQMLELDPAEPECATTVAGRIATLVRSVADGRFDIDPLDCSDYCPHRRVCRYKK
ncbi:MAG TPA: PD-(D/E)XK nuclease family protein, partial [Candidatus Binataceae bacterium]|nr:PD-(D/E)XK nuclease family protein [Candidatus Binataceae bacterium]